MFELTASVLSLLSFRKQQRCSLRGEVSKSIKQTKNYENVSEIYQASPNASNIKFNFETLKSPNSYSLRKFLQAMVSPCLLPQQRCSNIIKPARLIYDKYATSAITFEPNVLMKVPSNNNQSLG